MTKTHLSAYTIVLFLLPMVSTVHSFEPQTRECPGRTASEADRRIHETLLEYAILAEAIYSNQNRVTLDLHASCPNGVEPRRSPPSFTIESVPQRIIARAAVEINAAAEHEGNPQRQIETYVHMPTGKEFVICTTNRTLRERFAVAFRYVRGNERLSLLTEVAILGVASHSDAEEFRIRALRRNDGTTQGRDETVLGFQGTDFTSISQWNTTIQSLIADSCPFDLAVEVSIQFFETYPNEFRTRDNSIVGHSLGGAVAQHVAQHTDFESTFRQDHEGATFRAYSFNSIGVCSSTTDVAHQSKIVSVRVAGEILEQKEREFQTKQIGHVFRYGLSSGLGNQFQRHKIGAAKKALCRCLTKRHEQYEYGYR